MYSMTSQKGPTRRGDTKAPTFPGPPPPPRILPGEAPRFHPLPIHRLRRPAALAEARSEAGCPAASPWEAGFRTQRGGDHSPRPGPCPAPTRLPPTAQAPRAGAGSTRRLEPRRRGEPSSAVSGSRCGWVCPARRAHLPGGCIQPSAPVSAGGADEGAAGGAAAPRPAQPGPPRSLSLTARCRPPGSRRVSEAEASPPSGRSSWRQTWPLTLPGQPGFRRRG